VNRKQESGGKAKRLNGLKINKIFKSRLSSDNFFYILKKLNKYYVFIFFFSFRSMKLLFDSKIINNQFNFNHWVNFVF
jgi:hypothetical protein